MVLAMMAVLVVVVVLVMEVVVVVVAAAAAVVVEVPVRSSASRAAADPEPATCAEVPTRTPCPYEEGSRGSRALSSSPGPRRRVSSCAIARRVPSIA